MTAAFPLPRPTEPFQKAPYRQATWSSCERKVYACLLMHQWTLRQRISDGWIPLPNWAGSQWCSHFFDGDPYGSTGKRCFQEGLHRLKERGEVETRIDAHGARFVRILTRFPEPAAGPAAKPRGQGQGHGNGKPAPKPVPKPAPTPDPVPKPDDDRPAWKPAPALDRDMPPEYAEIINRIRNNPLRKSPRQMTDQEKDAEMERRRAAARQRWDDKDLTQPAPAAEPAVKPRE